VGFLFLGRRFARSVTQTIGENRRREMRLHFLAKAIMPAVTLAALLVAPCGVSAQQDAAQDAAANLKPETPAVQQHIDNARLLAGSDPNYLGVFALCQSPEAFNQYRTVVKTNAVAPPTKVFDQLYYLGMTSVGSWALATSAGIIQFDALDNTEEAQRIIVGGYKKLGLDPANIKYLVITHGHGDHYGGAKYLQDTYHPKVLMGAADWDMIAKIPATNARGGPSTPKPTRDQDVTDGEKITLGDTTVTLYITPGHTPATISSIIPVTDHGQPHVVSFWGGTNLYVGAAALEQYRQSLARFIKIGQEAKVDGYISNHTYFDHSFTDGETDKFGQLKTRKTGDPHPFILGTDSFVRYEMINYECAEANEARLRAKSSQ
jgi:metallo-beta-lactamase class B